MVSNFDERLDKMLCYTGDMSLKRRIKAIINDLNPQETDNILDCGCGDGFHLALLSDLTTCKLYGLDMDKHILEIARRNGIAGHLMRGDICHLPYPHRTFDKIICSEVLEHVPDDLRALKELRHVLKKDGHIIITVPNHNYPFMWDPLNKTLEKLFGKHVKTSICGGIWRYHLRLYYPEEIRSLVEAARFEVMDIKAISHYFLPFNLLILNSLRRLMSTRLMPTKIAGSMDRWSYKKEGKGKSTFNIVLMIFKLLNWFDKLNETISLDNSSVSIEIVARPAGNKNIL